MKPFQTAIFDLDGTLLPMDQDVFIKAYFSRLAAKLAPHGYDPEKLIKAIWGGVAQEGSIKKLQVNMANIRKKLGCKPGESRYIINELGVGYRMLDQQE